MEGQSGQTEHLLILINDLLILINHLLILRNHLLIAMLFLSTLAFHRETLQSSQWKRLVMSPTRADCTRT